MLIFFKIIHRKLKNIVIYEKWYTGFISLLVMMKNTENCNPEKMVGNRTRLFS